MPPGVGGFGSVSGVGYTRQEIAYLLPVWFMIRDAIEGEIAIKGEFGVRGAQAVAGYWRPNLCEFYLPRPNPLDKSHENRERYKQYVQRAVYYNFSRRTRDGLVGQVFLRPPVVKKPKALDCLDNNADGNGLQLIHVAKRTTQNALSYGRSGLFVDYPQTNGPQTAKQIKDNNIQPTIITYYPWQIINYATRVVGGCRVLSMVVLQELIIEEVDDFAVEEVDQHRVLRLDPVSGEYYQQIHQKKKASGAVKRNGKDDFQQVGDNIYPKDSEGNPIKTIPFTFVGSEANDIVPDMPPMYDLCSLNIAHYRNSADYEESSFVVGQPTPVITGVTKYWVDNVLHGAIQLGSRGSISLPEGGDAKLLQAAPNAMPKEAMAMKEEQALALGAKLVQVHKTARTATEVMVDTTSETSVLHNVAHNVSAAMEQCLRWACMFVGVVPVETTNSVDDTVADGAIQYSLNTEYELTRMNANDRLAVIKIWQSGGICYPEMRAVLKVDGTATMDDDAALKLIQAEKAAAALLGAAPIADPLQSVEPTAPENTPPDPIDPTKPAKPTKPGMKTPAKKAAAKKVASKQAA